MKNIFILFFFISFIGNAQDLGEIRTQYPKAVESTEVTEKLYGELLKINTSTKPVLHAYKGAILTLKAKFSKNKRDKKDFFKEGVSLLESAIELDSQNTEIRYIRLSVQENSPKFLGYHKNIEDDKNFILKNFGTIPSKTLKTIVKDFVLNSNSFNETEKLGLN
ncbi:hypothetical protein [Aequorivita sinensis]|uniref:hypothetical protein n=1 Tax=Aequorivita sinensis TaxID=1382458 RepID=UPI00111FADD1|nr:hypothetical protein [Aequorivita sinensis]